MSGFDASAMRSTSGTPELPWLSSLVTLVRIGRDGPITQAKSDAEKRAMLSAAHEGDLLLVAWPGKWSQDVFVVDDLVTARLAVGLPRKGQQAPPATGSQGLSRFASPGLLWRLLADVPALPVEGQRQLATRSADHYRPDEDAIALRRRTDLDPSARRTVLDGLSSFQAAPIVTDESCTPGEALELLDRFRTTHSVIKAALRRR